MVQIEFDFSYLILISSDGFENQTSERLKERKKHTNKEIKRKK
jgi:hypothetical protein